MCVIGQLGWWGVPVGGVMFLGLVGPPGMIYRKIQKMQHRPRGGFFMENSMNMDLGDTRLIIQTCANANLLRNKVAYVLATAYWETARTMQPVREYGGEAYLKKKRYYPYVGMGYVQLTWEANYKRASDELGVDFLAEPELLLEPEHAATILVTGMVEGWFTGRKLSDYITLQRSDFVGARRIINGVDRKNEIAMIAKKYDRALKAEGYGEVAAVPAIQSPPIPTGKPLLKSTTVWSSIGGVATTLAASIPDLNPWLVALVILLAAAIAVWIIRERRLKSVLFGL